MKWGIVLRTRDVLVSMFCFQEVFTSSVINRDISPKIVGTTNERSHQPLYLYPIS